MILEFNNKEEFFSEFSKGKFYVLVNIVEFTEFMEILEKYTKFKWNVNLKPTEFYKQNIFTKEIFIIVFNEVDLSYKIQPYQKEFVSFKDIKHLFEETKEEVIIGDGCVTLIIGDKTYKSTARDEKNDIEKGLMCCIAKANGYSYKKITEMLKTSKFEEKTLPNGMKIMKQHVYEVGDKVVLLNSNLLNTIRYINNRYAFFDDRKKAYAPISHIEGKVIKEPGYYSGKLVCIEGVGSFEKGKLYIVVDGEFEKFPLAIAHFKTLEEINERLNAKFIEFKGECL